MEIIEEFLSFFLKQVRGLGFAASAFLLLLGVAMGRDDSAREIITIAVVWLAAVGLHWLGGKALDRPIYDSLFGTAGRFKGVLASARTGAQTTFERLGWRIVSLQEASRKAFEHSEAWERRVELAYELSKAARTLVLPLSCLFVWEAMGGPLSRSLRESWLGNPSAVFSSALLSLALYLWLRVRHNRALYGLVTDAKSATALSSLMEIETLSSGDQDTGVAYTFYCQQAAAKGGPVVAGHARAETI